ncbi:MAG: hypothetical protein AB8B69_03095 [Chitinophagales bacterium]
MKNMVHTIDVQYLTDATGKQTAVQIPIEAWEEISEHLPTLLEYMTLRKSLMAGFKEVRQIQKGEKPMKTLDEFLKELE